MVRRKSPLPPKSPLERPQALSKAQWKRLAVRVKRCTQCPRLIDHCRTVANIKRKSYRDQTYWGKPVVNFGAPNVGLLVVGLAPGAHGANRTGRMFTGDRSGQWLYRALHRAGFSNRPNSESRRDRLELIDASITNICRCAPPDNKPAKEELANCRSYFNETIELCNPIVIVALGAMAWRATIPELTDCGWLEKPRRQPKFSHGEMVKLEDGRWLIGCYHPSQQNTFTGRLTESMLDGIFADTKQLIQKHPTRK